MRSAIVRDRLAHRLDAVAVGLDAAADLDLGRAKAALEPLARSAAASPAAKCRSTR